MYNEIYIYYNALFYSLLIKNNVIPINFYVVYNISTYLYIQFLKVLHNFITLKFKIMFLQEVYGKVKLSLNGVIHV